MANDISNLVHAETRRINLRTGEVVNLTLGTPFNTYKGGLPALLEGMYQAGLRLPSMAEIMDLSIQTPDSSDPTGKGVAEYDQSVAYSTTVWDPKFVLSSGSVLSHADGTFKIVRQCDRLANIRKDQVANFVLVVDEETYQNTDGFEIAPESYDVLTRGLTLERAKESPLLLYLAEENQDRVSDFVDSIVPPDDYPADQYPVINLNFEHKPRELPLNKTDIVESPLGFARPNGGIASIQNPGLHFYDADYEVIPLHAKSDAPSAAKLIGPDS